MPLTGSFLFGLVVGCMAALVSGDPAARPPTWRLGVFAAALGGGSGGVGWWFLGLPGFQAVLGGVAAGCAITIWGRKYIGRAT